MSAPVLVRVGTLSVRVQRRGLLVTGALVLAVLGLLVVALGTGAYAVPLPEVVATFAGRGSAAAQVIVLDLRLPRAAAAILCGLALGAAGAVLQSVVRNPLAGPDVVGLTQGAAAAAVLALTLFHAGRAGVAVAAVVGGTATAALVYVLAFRRGLHGYRLVLAGIGLAAVGDALVQYLLTRADLETAANAYTWIVGGLDNRTWPDVAVVGVAVAVLLPATVLLQRRLVLLEMGDEVATALGVRVERTRLAAVGGTVLLSAAATAVTGPIAFVALAAPQIARRLTRSTGPGVLPAAVTGALLLLAADHVAQHGFPDVALPAGVLTGAVGGLYLLWLLARRERA